MEDPKKVEIEAVKTELKVAFRTVAKEAGFRLKGAHALRHRDGAQQRMSLARVRNLCIVDMMVRLDRPGDRGEEVLSTWDASTSTHGFAVDAGEHEAHRATLRLIAPPPPEGRGPALERFMRLALPWFDEVSSREAIERMGTDNEYRLRTHGLVSRNFYDDFGLSLPPRQP